MAAAEALRGMEGAEVASAALAQLLGNVKPVVFLELV